MRLFAAILQPPERPRTRERRWWAHLYRLGCTVRQGDPESGGEARSVAQGGRFAKEIGKHTEGAVEKASPWIERLARVGYAAHGTVYALVGVLALRAAFGAGQTANQEGALRCAPLAPAREVLLGALAVGT